MVRFLTVVFITGCGIIVCYRPIKRLIKVAGIYKQMEQNDDERQFETRKLKYSSIEPETRGEYEELNNQIKNAFDTPVEGI